MGNILCNHNIGPLKRNSNGMLHEFIRNSSNETALLGKNLLAENDNRLEDKQLAIYFLVTLLVLLSTTYILERYWMYSQIVKLEGLLANRLQSCEDRVERLMQQVHQRPQFVPMTPSVPLHMLQLEFPSGLGGERTDKDASHSSTSKQIW